MSELFSRPRGWEVRSYLAGCPNLIEVSLVYNDGLPFAFEGCIPAFRGLRRLELLRLSHDNHDRDKEIADILVSCPDLHDLSLSMAGWPMGFDNGLLPKLIQRFCNKTKRRLRLRSLRLGYAFLPIESSTDYLQQLTDLTALDRLRLDNDNVGLPTILIDTAIDVKLFASAGNVTSFTAERLSSDVADLIYLLNTAGQLFNLSLPRFCETQPRARMDENNEFWDPKRYDEEVKDLPKDLCETMALESSENVPDRLERYRELVQRHDMGLLSHTTKSVQDPFRSNRESIVQDDKRAPLKY